MLPTPTTVGSNLAPGADMQASIDAMRDNLPVRPREVPLPKGAQWDRDKKEDYVWNSKTPFVVHAAIQNSVLVVSSPRNVTCMVDGETDTCGLRL